MLSKTEKDRPSMSEVVKSSCLCFEKNPKTKQFSASEIYEKIFLFRIRNQLYHSIINASFIKFVETKEYAEMFFYLDADGDGIITLSDFFVRMGASSVKKIARVFQDFGGTFLSFSEVIVAYFDWNTLMTDKNLDQIFKILDKDEDGFLSVNDFKKFSNEFQSLEYEFSRIDTNKDQLITLEEFKRVING